MSTPTFQIDVRPTARRDVLDLAERLDEPCLADCSALMLFSHHTTAGFLDAGLAWRLGRDPQAVRSWLQPYHRAFPPQASYLHDALHLRTELSAEQRETEPLNGDAHLVFMASGMQGCLTVTPGSRVAPMLVELDGTDGRVWRQRKVTVVGYRSEEFADVIEIDVPVSREGYDVVRLNDPEIGLLERIQASLEERTIEAGRIELRLAREERGAGLTLNEHEPLLVREDLAEAVRDASAFAARASSSAAAAGGSVRRNASSVPVPAHQASWWRFPRSLALAACANDSEPCSVILGRYQSPMLVQWEGPSTGRRRVLVRVHRFR